jgi:hypothetical protein
MGVTLIAMLLAVTGAGLLLLKVGGLYFEHSSGSAKSVGGRRCSDWVRISDFRHSDHLGCPYSTPVQVNWRNITIPDCTN